MRTRRRARLEAAAAQAAAVPELPEELLRAIAHAACTAAARGTMISVCRAWSAAVGGDEQLWEAIALRRFPRIKALAAALPGRVSYEALYRDQLSALKPRLIPPALTTTLDDYLFTFEIVRGGEVIASYIGPLQWDDYGGHVQMWPEGQRPADIPVISDEEDGDLFDGDHPGIDELGLRIFVTRKAPLSTLLLYDQPRPEHYDGDAMAWDWDHAPAPATIDAALPYLQAGNPELELPWQFRPWLSSRDGVLDTIFRGADLDPITDSKELITYLEQVAPWH
jgi:hypothetical protein